MWKNWFHQVEEKVGGDEKQKKRFRLFLLVGLVGVMVLILSSFFEVESHTAETEDNPLTKTGKTSSSKEIGTSTKMNMYEKEYESELADVLSQIVGVEDVSVIVNLDSTEEDVVHIDRRNSEQVTTEMDKRGNNRSIRNETDDQKPAFYQDEGGEKPLVIKKLKPKVRGILIVARGVENLQVRAAVIEAVQRTLDVPVHRISVLPKG